MNDLIEVQHIMRIIEETHDISYVTKWERLKKLIDVMVDNIDKGMAKEYATKENYNV